MRIDSRPALEEYTGGVRLVGLHTSAPIVLDLEWLAPEENAALQHEANRLLGACGCGSGAALSVVGVVLYALTLLLSSPMGSGVPILALVGGVAIFVLTGALGKLIGIAHARFRVRRLLLGALAGHPDPVTHLTKSCDERHT